MVLRPPAFSVASCFAADVILLELCLVHPQSTCTQVANDVTVPTMYDLKQALSPSYAGGTMVSVLEDIVSRGADPSNIIVVCVVAAPPALKKLSEKFVG